LLVEPGRPDVLAAALGSLLADRPRAAGHGARRAPAVEALFSWASVAERTCEVYAEARPPTSPIVGETA